MKKIFFLFILLQNAARPHIKDWSMPFFLVIWVELGCQVVEK